MAGRSSCCIWKSHWRYEDREADRGSWNWQWNASEVFALVLVWCLGRSLLLTVESCELFVDTNEWKWIKVKGKRRGKERNGFPLIWLLLFMLEDVLLYDSPTYSFRSTLSPFCTNTNSQIIYIFSFYQQHSSKSKASLKQTVHSLSHPMKQISHLEI